MARQEIAVGIKLGVRFPEPPSTHPKNPPFLLKSKSLWKGWITMGQKECLENEK